MKIKPTQPRDKPISVTVRGVKVRYDPVENADGLTLPDDLGRGLVKTGHWMEVEAKRTYKAPKVSTFVDEVKAAPDDSLSE